MFIEVSPYSKRSPVRILCLRLRHSLGAKPLGLMFVLCFSFFSLLQKANEGG